MCPTSLSDVVARSVGIASFAVGIGTLHLIEARIEGIGVTRRVYALTCFIGMVGLVLLAFAPEALTGSSVAFVAAGALVAFAGAMAARSRADRAPSAMIGAGEAAPR